MRSEEEFKAELFRRCDIYQKRQKEKRRKRLFVGTPLAACMAVLMLLFVPAIRHSNLVPSWNHSKTGSSEQSGFLWEFPGKDGNLTGSLPPSEPVPAESNSFQTAFIDVTSLMTDSAAEPSDTLHYMDPAKVEQLLYYLDALSPTRISDHTEETQAIRRITVTYPDGSTRTYIQYESNKFYRDDGTWMVLKHTDAEAFQQLINELSLDSDKKVN